MMEKEEVRKKLYKSERIISEMQIQLNELRTEIGEIRQSIDDEDAY